MACVYILQAAQTGMWPQPSITLGTGKPKSEPHPASKMGEIKPEEKIKQVRLDLFLVGFSHTSILFVLQVFCKVAQSIYYLEKAGSSACLTPPLPPPPYRETFSGVVLLFSPMSDRYILLCLQNMMHEVV